MSEKSLTEQMIDAIVVHMDANDFSPVVFRRDNHPAYTCIGACRSLMQEVGLDDEKPYFMTVGLGGLGIVSEGRVSEDQVREALKMVLDAGLRGYNEKNEVISFM